MNRIPEQLERLIAERYDGNLTAAELADVERAIRTNADAEKMAKQYDQLGRLLTAFRVLPSDVDLVEFERTVSRDVADEAAYHASLGADASIDPAAVGDDSRPAGPHFDPLKQQFERVDELLEQSFRPLPPIDWNAFHQRVTEAVKAEAGPDRRGRVSTAQSARKALRLRWLVRAAVPLAAAAVLLIVFRQSAIDTPSLIELPTTPRPTMVSVAVDRPRQPGQVLITFDRAEPPGVMMPEQDRGGIIIATTGAGAPAVDVDTVEMALLF